MLNKASSLGTLANPVRFYDFLDAATSSIVSDPELGNLSNLIGLQRELKRIGLDNVNFLHRCRSLPYAPDPNRLAPGADAELLWEDLRTDSRLSYRFLEDATSGAEGDQFADEQPDSAPLIGEGGTVVDSAALTASAPARSEAISDEEAEEFGFCRS